MNNEIVYHCMNCDFQTVNLEEITQHKKLNEEHHIHAEIFQPIYLNEGTFKRFQKIIESCEDMKNRAEHLDNESRLIAFALNNSELIKRWSKGHLNCDKNGEIQKLVKIQQI